MLLWYNKSYIELHLLLFVGRGRPDIRKLTDDELEKINGGYDEDDLPGYYDDQDGQDEDEEIIPIEEILRRLS